MSSSKSLLRFPFSAIIYFRRRSEQRIESRFNIARFTAFPSQRVGCARFKHQFFRRILMTDRFLRLISVSVVFVRRRHSVFV